MPLNRRNTRTFTRCLFGGILEKITVLKRGDDQLEGTVTAYTLYQCRKSMVIKSGEAIQTDMSSDYRTVWHIPRRELDRVGINYINALDRIVELEGADKGRTWQPESTTEIVVKLFTNEVDINCLSLTPRS